MQMYTGFRILIALTSQSTLWHTTVMVSVLQRTSSGVCSSAGAGNQRQRARAADVVASLQVDSIALRTVGIPISMADAGGAAEVLLEGRVAARDKATALYKPGRGQSGGVRQVGMQRLDGLLACPPPGLRRLVVSAEAHPAGAAGM